MKRFADRTTAIPMPAWFPLLSFALAMWMSCVFYLCLSSAFLQGICLATSLASLASALVLFVALSHGHSSFTMTVLLALLGCSLGILVSSVSSYELHENMTNEQDSGLQLLVLQVVEDSKSGDYGSSCIAQGVDSKGNRIRLRVNLPNNEMVNCWQVIQMSCPIKAPSSEAQNYYWSRGLSGSVSPAEIRIEEASGLIGCIADLRSRGLHHLDSLPKDTIAGHHSTVLLKALLFGDRRVLANSQLYADVKTIGIAHIVAVSGAHLGIALGLLTGFLNTLRFPKKVTILSQLLFLILFVFVTGAPISVMRSAVMAFFAIFSIVARRRSSPINGLSLCIIAFLLNDPFLALSISFALSLLSCLGIILLGAYLAKALSSLTSKTNGAFSRALNETLAVCVAANIMTIPISAAVFGQFSLIAPFSNLLITPLFSLILASGMLGCAISLFIPSIAKIALMPSLVLSELFCELIAMLSSLPYACIPADINIVTGLLIGSIVVAGLFYAKPVLSVRCIAIALESFAIIILVSVWVIPRFSGPQIIMLDVGQGDALLLKDGSHAVLVDTGMNDSQVISGLGRYGISKLNAVIISHPDKDHCDSFSAVKASTMIENVCVAKDLYYCDSANCKRLLDDFAGVDVLLLEKGDQISFGGFCVNVIAPEYFTCEGGNEDSLVLMVTYDFDKDGSSDISMLTSGDAEVKALRKLNSEGLLQDVDILKVPHHGSQDGLSEDLLSVLNPEIALISVGANNRYGHPSLETVKLLMNKNCKIMRTDLSGDLVCNLSHDGIQVRTVK